VFSFSAREEKRGTLFPSKRKTYGFTGFSIELLSAFLQAGSAIRLGYEALMVNRDIANQNSRTVAARPYVTHRIRHSRDDEKNRNDFGNKRGDHSAR